MITIAVILQLILGVIFLGAGGTKVLGVQERVQMFERFGYPKWFLHFTGIREVIGGLGMWAGIAVAWLAAPAGIWLVADTIGAIYTHRRHRDSVQRMAVPTVLTILATAVIALRWSALSHQLAL